MVALALCLIGGVGASAAQSSFGAVRVENLRDSAGDGTVINGQIFMPRKASAENKLPLIAVSRGSYHNMDMRDLNMIELSRRGFVVISSDAYNHGSSSLALADTGVFPAKNMYQLIACASFTFIDQKKISVSGHSMGGIISSATLSRRRAALVKTEFRQSLTWAMIRNIYALYSLYL